MSYLATTLDVNTFYNLRYISMIRALSKLTLNPAFLKIRKFKLRSFRAHLHIIVN